MHVCNLSNEDVVVFFRLIYVYDVTLHIFAHTHAVQSMVVLSVFSSDGFKIYVPINYLIEMECMVATCQMRICWGFFCFIFVHEVTLHVQWCAIKILLNFSENFLGYFDHHAKEI